MTGINTRDKGSFFVFVMMATILFGLAPSARAALVYAYAWGDNTYGQLGNGDTTSSPTPLVISSLSSGVTAVSGGAYHSVALNGGIVYAWGRNNFGQLGSGNTTNNGTPTAVSGLPTGVTAISAGFAHNLALQGGAVFTWGYNDDGELGTGTTGGYSTTPAAVTTLASGVTAISAGAFHNLVIKGGGVYSWGTDFDGELGDGGSGGANGTPMAISGALSSGVTAVASGSFHSLAVKGGAVYAFGLNSSGQLGNGTTSNSSTPITITSLSSGVSAVAAGVVHSLALKGGSVYAWGNNYDGQLGLGAATGSTTPVQVDPTDLSNIVAIAAAEFSSYALSSDGSLWVWGGNYDDELGLGTTGGKYSTPQHLLAPSGYAFTSISNSTGEEVLATLIAVPEPTSIAMLCVSGVVFFRRRRTAEARTPD